MNYITPPHGDFNKNPINNPAPTHTQVKKAMNARKSQCEQALEIMKRDGSISSIQMQSMGWLSGPKRISELVKLGHIIVGIPDWNQNGAKTYHYKGKQNVSNLIGGSHGDN